MDGIYTGKRASENYLDVSWTNRFYTMLFHVLGIRLDSSWLVLVNVIEVVP